MTEKTVKQVCKCENCGNEAEMVVTCTLPDPDQKGGETAGEQTSASPKEGKSIHRVKGTATCTTCGNEADMWVDLE